MLLALQNTEILTKKRETAISFTSFFCASTKYVTKACFVKAASFLLVGLKQISSARSVLFQSPELPSRFLKRCSNIHFIQVCCGNGYSVLCFHSKVILADQKSAGNTGVIPALERKVSVLLSRGGLGSCGAGAGAGCPAPGKRVSVPGGFPKSSVGRHLLLPGGEIVLLAASPALPARSRRVALQVGILLQTRGATWPRTWKASAPSFLWCCFILVMKLNSSYFVSYITVLQIAHLLEWE